MIRLAGRFPYAITRCAAIRARLGRVVPSRGAPFVESITVLLNVAGMLTANRCKTQFRVTAEFPRRDSTWSKNASTASDWIIAQGEVSHGPALLICHEQVEELQRIAMGPAPGAAKTGRYLASRAAMANRFIVVPAAGGHLTAYPDGGHQPLG